MSESLNLEQVRHEAPAAGPLLRIIKDQRMAFLLVGGFNTLLGYLLFLAFHGLIGDSLGRFGYMVALVCSYAVGILCAFFLHRYLVFRVRGSALLDLARFTLVNLVNLAINSVLLPLIVESTGARPTYAQILAAVLTAIASYFGHKHFSFRRTKTNHNPTSPGE